MRTDDDVYELFLNYACQARCPFCYNPPLTPELLKRDLSFSQATESLYAGARSGARRLNIHGGEVTLRDDLPKILLLARKLGFKPITLVTNGIRLSDPDYVSALVDCGVTHFRLSIHAPDAAAHDSILAIPGAFERVLKAIGNIRCLDASLGINFVLIQRNYKALPGFIEKFCGELEIDDVIVYFPHLRGMMAINAGAAGVTYQEAAPFVRRAFSILDGLGRRSSLLLANFTPCVLPEFADRMLDWATEHKGKSSLTHPEGFTEDLNEMKGSQRAAVGACSSCSLEKNCMGVEKEYRDFYGEGGFSPIQGDFKMTRA